MQIRCVWEHNGEDTLLYADNLPGAFARGATKEEALFKMVREANAYLRWRGEEHSTLSIPVIVQDKPSGLAIRDADSDVLFDSEREPLTMEAYAELKALALRSAADFEALYQAVPDKEKSCMPLRETFYGPVPRTASEMYEHTKNVNDYYFAEIGVEVDHEGDIVSCRERGFALLEKMPDYLQNRVFEGSYGELWSLRKVLRRFIWHDRIHARAMYRMALRTFGDGSVPDIFHFES